jgi:hypothetical protein
MVIEWGKIRTRDPWADGRLVRVLPVDRGDIRISRVTLLAIGTKTGDPSRLAQRGSGACLQPGKRKKLRVEVLVRALIRQEVCRNRSVSPKARPAR